MIGIGVNSFITSVQIVQMLSTRQASLAEKLKVLKDIASENGISLENEEISFIMKQVNLL